jgi:hypothetical protein
MEGELKRVGRAEKNMKHLFLEIKHLFEKNDDEALTKALS